MKVVWGLYCIGCVLTVTCDSCYFGWFEWQGAFKFCNETYKGKDFVVTLLWDLPLHKFQQLSCIFAGRQLVFFFLSMPRISVGAGTVCTCWYLNSHQVHHLLKNLDLSPIWWFVFRLSHQLRVCAIIFPNVFWIGKTLLRKELLTELPKQPGRWGG